MLGFHCDAQAFSFSSCSGRALLSNCGVWASQSSGFFYCRTLALGCLGFSSCRLSRVQYTDLVAQGMWDLSSSTRDQTHVPCIGRRILNCWTTRKSLYMSFYVGICCYVSWIMGRSRTARP